MTRSAMIRAAAALAVLAAAACARDEPVAPRDVAARVNGGEVPLRRVQAALSREPALASADRPEAQSRALEAAIDQELLVQQALAARLDRDPGVLRSLDESRRRILAQAWLDKSAADRVRPDPREVSAFYAANPALFAARRIYTLREIAIGDGHGREAALRAVAAARDEARIEQWLDGQGLRYQANDATRPAEALPLALLAELKSMKDGDIAVIGGERGALTVVQLVRSQPAPVSEEQARERIGRFLASRRRLELAREEIARLRGEAHIEYLAGHGPAARARAPRAPANAVAVTASIETPYDPTTQAAIGAHEAPGGKDERS